MLALDANCRRNHPRHPRQAVVSPSCELGSYFSVDLSREGMRVLRLKGAGPKTRVFGVTIPLGGAHQKVHALAEAVRVEARGALEEVALRFRYLAPEDQRTLDAYLATRD